MEYHPEDRRSLEFSRALAADMEEPMPVMAQVHAAWRRTASEGPLLILLLAFATLALLLIVRPPFVLKFTQDQKRPWRGCTHLSWPSVLVTVALVAATPVALKFALGS